MVAAVIPALTSVAEIIMAVGAFIVAAVATIEAVSKVIAVVKEFKK